MNKELVKNCILEYQKNLINELKEAFKDKEDDVVIDETDTRDADTFSHQSQSQADEELINNRLKKAEDSLEYFKNLTKSAHDKVELGALIESENLVIYVGITTKMFVDNGKNIIGISTDAPIYKTLKDQTVGFEFTLGNMDCKILSIH